MKPFTSLVPHEYNEMLRMAKTEGEILFVCRVLKRKRLASEDTLHSVCNLYGVNFQKAKDNGFVSLPVDSAGSKA